MAVLVTNPKGKITKQGSGKTLANPTELDFIVWNSIQYGLTRVGGPVLMFDDDPDLSEVTELCIVGHGSPGQIEGRSAEVIADRLTKGAKAVPDTFSKLIVTSCYAGSLVGGQKGTAVIDVIAKALAARGIKGVEISGALGPSIKSNELGDRFRVVKDSKLGKAGPIQDTKIINHGLGVKETGTGKVQRLKGGTTDPKLAEQAARMMAKISGEFYKDFVDELEKQRTLFDPDHSMRTVTS